MHKPEDIQIIGDEVAIRWSDGAESYYPMHMLRALSPSAENTGERDLLGQVIGGDNRGFEDFAGVRVEGWEPVGGYAIQFQFSDGHRTGLYSYSYLREIAERLGEG